MNNNYRNHWGYLIIIALLSAILAFMVTLYIRTDTPLVHECRGMGGTLWCVDSYGNRYSDLLRRIPVAGASGSAGASGHP